MWGQRRWLWKVQVSEEKCRGELKDSGVRWKEAVLGPYSLSIDWKQACYVVPSSMGVFQRCGIRWRDSGRLSGLSKHMSGFDGNESVGKGVSQREGRWIEPREVWSPPRLLVVK